MDDCVWLLSRWLEMSPGLLGGSTDCWESLLPNWHCSFSRSLNLVDDTHWCDRIYIIIWPTCSGYPLNRLNGFHHTHSRLFSPHSNIWVIGHSLGGSLASLVGITYGAPVVTFEAPGERLAASRLHLPSPVSLWSSLKSFLRTLSLISFFNSLQLIM